LPANLKPLLSKGYKPGTSDPQPYEVIGMAPAGALSSSGADMGRFMIAHLNHTLLNPATAQQMYANANKPYSALPAMALGFYHEDRNGLNIVGHGGDTVFFHSDLHLFLDKNVGLYISMNSIGKAGAAHSLREELLQEFADRYFPAPAENLPTASTAKQHGQAMSGHYVSSRAGGFNFLRLAALLGQTTASLDKDNNLVVSSITDLSGSPRKWREVGPWVWQEVNGADKLEAVPDGKGGIKMFSITPYAPIIEFLPAPASLNAGWIFPVGGIALLVLLIAALGWPVVALVRRKYKYQSDVSGRALQLHRATRATAWLYIAIALGWFLVLTAVNKDLGALNGGLDIWMRLLQVLLVVAIVGTLVAIWNAVTIARGPGRRWVAVIWAVLIALSAVFFAWLCIDLGLLTAQVLDGDARVLGLAVEPAPGLGELLQAGVLGEGSTLVAQLVGARVQVLEVQQSYLGGRVGLHALSSGCPGRSGVVTRGPATRRYRWCSPGSPPYRPGPDRPGPHRAARPARAARSIPLPSD